MCRNTQMKGSRSKLFGVGSSRPGEHWGKRKQTDQSLLARRLLDGQRSQSKVCLRVSYSGKTRSNWGRVHSISQINYELCIIPNNIGCRNTISVAPVCLIKVTLPVGIVHLYSQAHGKSHCNKSYSYLHLQKLFLYRKKKKKLLRMKQNELIKTANLPSVCSLLQIPTSTAGVRTMQAARGWWASLPTWTPCSGHAAARWVPHMSLVLHVHLSRLFPFWPASRQLHPSLNMQ